MSSSVRTGHQTTYPFHDREAPSRIRVVHPSHPLCGHTLKVVRSRRQGEERHWVVELDDGSRLQIPSSQTDSVHPGGPALRDGASARATPHALRELLRLLEMLVPPHPTRDARGNEQLRREDCDEPTTASVRAPASALGRSALASSVSGETPCDRGHRRGDGEDEVDPDSRGTQPRGTR